MPLPNPKAEENKADWISRCMSNDSMKQEFPDHDQRVAVCHRKWRDKDENEERDARQKIERRSFAGCELRVSEPVDDRPLTIQGYAAVFNSLSEEFGFGSFAFRERIAKGAFAKTLANGVDVRALVDHETGLMTIGRTRNGTLKLHEDDKGLFATIYPPDTNAGRDIVELVRRRDLDQMSFGFDVPEKDGDRWERGEDYDIRTIIEVDTLYDVSVVTFPMYVETSIAVRSMRAWYEVDLVDLVIARQRIKDERQMFDLEVLDIES